MNLNNNKQEFQEVQFEEYAMKRRCDQNNITKKTSPPRIVPIERKNWINNEPTNYSFFDRYFIKLQRFCLQGEHVVEISIESVSENNSHSWVRISHGLHKLFTDLVVNEKETSQMQYEENALKLNASDFASL